MKPIYKISLPEYTLDEESDFDVLGKKIDAILKKHYFGQKVVVRALGSQEHSGKNAEELAKIIQETGTDRYDPNRKGDRYENIEQKHIDFFGMDFLITKSGEYFKFLLEPFYSYPPKPVRIDIAIIYDPEQLEVIEHQYEGREGEIKKDGFAFKDHDKKQDAVKGIILIEN